MAAFSPKAPTTGSVALRQRNRLTLKLDKARSAQKKQFIDYANCDPCFPTRCFTAQRKGKSMEKILLPVLRTATPALLGALGAVVAMVYPIGHKAFCSGAIGGFL